MEHQLIRAGDFFAVIGVFRQGQGTPGQGLRRVGTVGHQHGGVGPPAGGRIRSGLHLVHGVRRLLQPLDHILPQRHGGNGGTDLPQKPVIVTVQRDGERTAVFSADRQQGHIPGGAGLLIAADNGQKRRVDRRGGRVRQALPRIHEIPGLDLNAIGPFPAPQTEGIGHGAIGVFLDIHVLCGAAHSGNLAVFVLFQPHEVFIEVI